MAGRAVLLAGWWSVVGCGGAGSPTPDSSASGPATGNAGTRSVEVAANQGWQDTGIMLKAQQSFTLTLKGGQIVEQDVTVAHGEGRDFVCGDPGCCDPLPDERRGTVIGRIAGEIFVVGNGGQYTAQADGVLSLRVNDCDSGLGDNRGSLVFDVVP
ncbi:MAG: hypothetical protein ACT4QD_01935 [Acidobacteriota bacterium]